MWKKISNKGQIITIVVATIFLMLLLNQCNTSNKLRKEAKRQEQISKQNMAALSDSIEVYKNKIGLNSYSKPIAAMSADDIKKYFPDLYTRLKNELGEVKIIWNTQIEYVDTGSVHNSVLKLDSNKYTLNYLYRSKDSSLMINSTNTFFVDVKVINDKYTINTIPGISTINSINLKLGFTTGIKKENDLYKIFITPDNKNVTVGKIEGADVSNLINPSSPSCANKRWSIGPYVGFGINFDKDGYTVGPGIGVSLQYSLIRF